MSRADEYMFILGLCLCLSVCGLAFGRTLSWEYFSVWIELNDVFVTNPKKTRRNKEPGWIVKLVVSSWSQFSMFTCQMYYVMNWLRDLVRFSHYSSSSFSHHHQERCIKKILQSLVMCDVYKKKKDEIRSYICTYTTRYNAWWPIFFV